MREAADPAAVVSAARRWLGTPYHDQASVRGVGCDCLGLARGVWREVVGPEPEAVGPYTRDWGEVGQVEHLLEGALRWMLEVPLASAGAGSVILFRMRARAIAKHVGILVAEDRLIHAREGLGVIEEPFGLAWRRRAVAAFLYPKQSG